MEQQDSMEHSLNTVSLRNVFFLTFRARKIILQIQETYGNHHFDIQTTERKWSCPPYDKHRWPRTMIDCVPTKRRKKRRPRKVIASTAQQKYKLTTKRLVA